MPDPQSSTPSTPGPDSSSGGSTTGASRPGSQSTSPAHEVELPYPEELQAMLGGAYEVESFLGQGGMGAVYRGLQMPLRRPVAIKILARGVGEDYGFEERFKREAYAMAALTHPNIVQVYDCGNAGEHFLFISMELVEGGDLSDALKANQITPEVALKLMPQICDGLHAAHERGIVHRDIKPANIFLTADGRPKVADFGLAKKFDGAGTMVTKTGLGLGTPDYAAPEQYDNAPDIDHRADVYSMGVMFYQLLTGRLPRGSWKAPSTRVAIDPRLDDVVLHAMAADRAERYQTVADFKAGILAVTSQPARTGSGPAQAPVGTRTAAVPLPTAGMRTGSVPPRTGPVAPRQTGAVPAARHTGAVPQPRQTGAVRPVGQQTGAVPSRTQAVPARRTASAAVPAPVKQGGGARTAIIATVVCVALAAGAWMFMKGGGGGPGGGGAVVELLGAGQIQGAPLKGDWTATAAGLECRTPPLQPGQKDEDRMPFFELHYTPPEEYDFELEFTRSSGSIIHILSSGGAAFAHVFSTATQHDAPARAGLQELDGKSITATTEGYAMVLPPPYTVRNVAVVQVRRGSVRSFLNGKPVLHWTGDFSRLSMPAKYGAGSGGQLGIGVWNGAATFHRATVREISGAGQSTGGGVLAGSQGSGSGMPREKVYTVAEWVLSQKGSVVVQSGGVNRKVTQIEDLPKGSLDLLEVDVPDYRPVAAVPPAVLRALAEAQRLKRLALRDADHDTLDLARVLEGKTELIYLNLNGCKVDNGIFDVLSRLHALEALELSWCKSVTGTGVEQLASLPKLTSLNLNDTGVTDAAFASIARLRALKTLHLNNVKITDEGLKGLSGQTNLEIVNVKNTDVTVRGLEALRAATKLRRIEVTMGRGIKEVREVAALASTFPAIKEMVLEFYTPQATEVAPQLARLADLAPFANLTRLELRGGTAFRCSMIAGLAELPALDYLDVSYPFADEDTAILKGARNLRYLRLGGADLTEQGALQLMGIATLRDVNASAFTAEALKSFKLHRPDVKVL